MAIGEKFYELLDELGGMPDEPGPRLVLENLVKFLQEDTVSSFVEIFRREYEMTESSKDE